MRKIIGFLFPWRQTFRRLELEKYWWHRLAVVLCFVALVPVFLYSWVIGVDANAPVHSFGGDIQYWEILPAPPNGYTIDAPFTPSTSPPDNNSVGQGKIAAPIKDVFDVVANHISDANLRKTIQMPDGVTATYLGTVPNETIEAEWRHRLKIAKTGETLLGIGIAALVTVVFSYLLQAAYRALIYVIYGAKVEAAPSAPPGQEG